jgi:phosphoribosyl 1,2-cyclic phosphodiesterase
VRFGTHTACVALEVPKEEPIVLDLGSGLRRWSQALAAAADDGSPGGTGEGPPVPLRAAALVSHLHWGHVQGLPDFAPLEHPGTVLDVFGPRPDEGPLARVVADTLGPPWFRERVDERPATVRFHEVHDEELAVGTARVMVRSVPHGTGVTHGYRVDRGGVTVAYVPDHDPPSDLDGVAEGVLELADRVDLLVHDAQLSAADWPGGAGRGHSPVGYAVLVAREAGACRLALFHHAPDRDDDELDHLLAVARRSAERLGVDEVLSAYEGLTVCLEPS